MLSFLKKSRAAFGGLHHNELSFLMPALVALFYSLSLTFTIQSGTAFGVLFNVLVFAFLGAGIREEKSLFHSLAVSPKEKVNLAYKTFCFWAVAVLFFKGFKFLIWKSFTLQIMGGTFLESFYWSEPSMTAYYAIWVYGFFISIGFECLLFPILFIEKNRSQVIYFVKVALVALLPTFAFNSIGSFLFKVNTERLSTGWISLSAFTAFPPAFLQGLVLYAALFMIAAIIYAQKIALNHYNESFENRKFFVESTEGIVLKKKRSKRIIIGSITLVIVVFITGIIYISSQLTKAYGEVKDLEIAGTQLTEDHVFGPMLLGNQVYFPTHQEIEMKEEEQLGFFTFKGEDATGLFYRLFISNFAIVDKADPQRTYCKVEGADMYTYVKAQTMEQSYPIKEYVNIMTFDADWLDQHAMAEANSRVGMHDVDPSLFRKLEERFGAVAYRSEDFDQIDAFYALVGVKKAYVQDKWQPEADYYLNYSDVLGCILVKNGQYYYGNLENKIPEDWVEMIKKILMA